MTAAPFPLAAIVGQEELVTALLINAVAPDVGGVLVRGHRGTAKSTAVRGLAPLLSAISDHPAPLVEVPLGATLDRLVGSLDVRRALEGEHQFEPGLLARAHGGILYVDEVNLLPDHLVDALLDAAASGVARVERDAVSVEHEARFMLVGTMNVEEGELRPQLLDRFGLGVDVRGPDDPAVRAEIVRRRLTFEHDPDRFMARWGSEQRAMAERIARARACLDAVHLHERELLRITGACARLGIDGVRGDIVWSRAARALAALDGAATVDESHVHGAASLALAHRRRRDPLGGEAELGIEDALDGGEPEPEPPEPDPPEPGPRGPSGAGPAPGANGDAPAPGPGGGAPARERQPDDSSPTRSWQPDDSSAAQSSEAGCRAGRKLERMPSGSRLEPPAAARIPAEALRLDRAGRGPHGRRARTAGADAGSIDSRPASAEDTDIAVVATLRAREPRVHIRAGREGVLLCLVVDASGSMGARKRLARVKGALHRLLRDAYARRDRVAIIAFGEGGARLLVAPGTPLERAAAAVRELPTGGRTPLAAGLELAAQVLRREAAREPSRRGLAVVLTDGRVADPAGAARGAAAALGRMAAAVHVIDTEDGPVRLGLAASLAAAAGGQHHSLRSAA
ncbi:MAG TPA: VWA domain-containing protein [Solirubrobacteraceae bacterium]|nr:VWA domain-containing protein [Solirubrobacteraceae bacterium]